MSDKTKILFVDDDPRYAEPLIDKAYNEFNFELDYYEDWEEAKTQLIGNESDYAAIIIDGRGKLSQGSKGDDPKHLNVVLSDLRQLEGKGKYIPYVINTAYYEELTQYFGEEKMVSKKDQDKLFEILQELVSGSELEKLKAKYNSAFAPFNKNIIDKKYQHILVEMLTCLEEQDYKKKNLNVVRDMLEAFFLTLIENYECIPEVFKNTNGKPNHEGCTRFIFEKAKDLSSGIEYTNTFKIPKDISWTIRYVKEIANGFSHISENETLKNPFISSTYAMLTILEWLPGFIEEKFE